VFDAESLSTLKFANRAKNIKNSAQVRGVCGKENRLASKNGLFSPKCPELHQATPDANVVLHEARISNAPRLSIHSITLGRR